MSSLVSEILKLQEELPRFTEPLRIESKSLVVSADYHAPLFSLDWVQRMMAVAKKHKATDLLVAGDLADQNYASVFQQLQDDVPDIGLEKRSLKYLVELLRTQFQNVFLLIGNHELRLYKHIHSQLKGGINLTDYVDMFISPEVQHGRHTYQYAFVNDDTVVVHPRNYSQIPARIAARLTDEKFHLNVVTAGGHQGASIVPSKSGKFWAMDIGTMCEEELTAYRALQVTLHPGWHNGFGILKQRQDGSTYPINVNDLWAAPDA